MPEEVAGIAMPEGDPSAIADAAQSMGKLAQGFSYVAQNFRNAAGATPSWQGPAASAAQGSLQSCAQAADASQEACIAARVEVDRYAADFEEAHNRVKRLQEEAREVEEQLRQARREAAEAGKRAAEARGRAAAAMMASPIDLGGGAMAAQRQAEREAQTAEAEQARWERRATHLQEELEELRERAADQRKTAREAEGRAAAAVISAEAQFPSIPAGAQPGALPVANGGQAPSWPFAGPLMAGGPLLGRPLQPRPGEGDDEEDDGGPFQFVDDAWDATAGARHGTGNFTSGLTNELSFGAVDLGGDKDSGAYKTGEGASYVPFNPASAVKSLGTGAVKLGSKVLGKEAAEEGAETAVKRNLDEGASFAPRREPNQYWTKSTDFEGHRIHQRDDLIDPARTDRYGISNAERMRDGAPPIGPDGKPLNLHHTTQRNNGGLAEVEQTFHQKNHKVIHINPNSTPSGIDRAAFRGLRRRYWQNRADDLQPDTFDKSLDLDLLGAP